MLQVFHGDNHGTKKLDIALMNNGNNQEWVGIYFSDNIKDAENYGQDVVSVLINEDNFINSFYAIKKQYLFLVFTTGLLVIMFSQELLYFMTSEKFYEAYYLVPFIVLAAISKGIYMLYAVLLMIQKKTKLLSQAVLLGAIVNIGINLLFMKEYGSIVAAISTFVAFLTMTMIVHVKTFQYYSFSLLKEAKEYFIVFGFLVLSYLLYYYLDIKLTLNIFLIKILISTFLLFTLLKFYDVKVLNLLKKVKHAN